LGVRLGPGQLAITPQFDRAWSFEDGLAAVVTGKQVGYIDTSGTYVIPLQFDYKYRFPDGSVTWFRSAWLRGWR